MLKVLVVGKTLIVNRNDRAVAVQEYNNPNELRATLRDMKDSGAISSQKYNHLIEVVDRQNDRTTSAHR